MYLAQVRMVSILHVGVAKPRSLLRGIQSVAPPSKLQVRLQRPAALCRRVKNARLRKESAVKNKEWVVSPRWLRWNTNT